jgi:hypothetical protein
VRRRRFELLAPVLLFHFAKDLAMSFQRSLISAAAVAASAALSCGPVHAALTAFTSSASFAAAVVAPATDTFALLPLDAVPSPTTRTASPSSYVASAPGGLFGGGTAANPWLSTNLSGATMALSSFSSVRAVGGTFFGSDITGGFLAGQTLTLTAIDSLGATLTQTLANATSSSFLGFVSTGSMVSLLVSIADRDAFVSIDNVVLASPVPEPETYAMLLAGLAGLAGFARRRRRPA